MANGHGGARAGAGRPKDSQSSRSRFQAAQARKEEHLAELRHLEVERRKGALVARDDVIRTWQNALIIARQRLLALPSKIAAEAAHQDAHRVHAIVKREIYAALTELSRCDGMPREEPLEP